MLIIWIKIIFLGGLLEQYSDIEEIDKQITTMALKKLREDLNSVMQDYKEKNKNIAAKHTQNFIKKLDDIITQESKDVPIEQ